VGFECATALLPTVARRGRHDKRPQILVTTADSRSTPRPTRHVRAGHAAAPENQQERGPDEQDQANGRQHHPLPDTLGAELERHAVRAGRNGHAAASFFYRQSVLMNSLAANVFTAARHKAACPE